MSNQMTKLFKMKYVGHKMLRAGQSFSFSFKKRFKRMLTRSQFALHSSAVTGAKLGEYRFSSTIAAFWALRKGFPHLFYRIRGCLVHDTTQGISTISTTLSANPDTNLGTVDASPVLFGAGNFKSVASSTTRCHGSFHQSHSQNRSTSKMSVLPVLLLLGLRTLLALLRRVRLRPWNRWRWCQDK